MTPLPTTFIAPPKILCPPLNLAPPKFNFLLRSPPQLFWSEIFRSPPKIRGAATMWMHFSLIDTLVDVVPYPQTNMLDWKKIKIRAQ